MSRPHTDRNWIVQCGRRFEEGLRETVEWLRDSRRVVEQGATEAYRRATESLPRPRKPLCQLLATKTQNIGLRGDPSYST